MSFDGIDFCESGRRDRPGLGLYVRGYWVGKTTMEMAWKQVAANLAALNLGEKQTAETLCGKAFWQEQNCSKRLSLGRCVKFLVDQEFIPLQVANPGKKGKRKYVRK